MTLRRIESVEIRRKPGRYLSFPDVIRTASGKLLCAFRGSDIHYPPSVSETELRLIESFDGGRTWVDERVFPHRPGSRMRWCWHCPRFSLMRDGRLALICDFVQPTRGLPEVFVSFSGDEGVTWSDPNGTGACGIIPDRLIDFGSGEWGFAAHWSAVRSSGVSVLSERFYATVDAGAHWQERSVIAEDDEHHYCEGSIALGRDSTLSCYMRENSFLHLPTYVSVSKDRGRSWSAPEYHPTHGHRPSVGFLDNEKILLTYRNVSGNPGLYAWLGSSECRGYEVGGFCDKGAKIEFDEQGMIVDTEASSPFGVEFNLMPIQSYSSELRVRFSVRRIRGERFSCAFRGVGALLLLEKKIGFCLSSEGGNWEKAMCLGERALDTSVFHTYDLIYSGGSLRILVDGEEGISATIPESAFWRNRKLSFGNLSSDPPNLIDFSEHRGINVWSRVSLGLNRADGEIFEWSWDASTRRPPNDYQRRRCVEIDSETSGDWAESGYSGWTRLSEKSVFCVDYKRGEAEKPYIVGHVLELDF